MPEVKVGLPSVIEAALLPRLVGWGQANWLMHTGETIDADRAERWGLVEWKTEEGKLEDGTRALIDSIVAAGPRATRLQKQLVTRWEALSLEKATVAGIDCVGEAFEGKEPGAYMRKFLDRPR